MYKVYTKDCVWYRQVYFSPESKAWLRENKPPKAFIVDLKKIIKNNEKFESICK